MPSGLLPKLYRLDKSIEFVTWMLPPVLRLSAALRGVLLRYYRSWGVGVCNFAFLGIVLAWNLVTEAEVEVVFTRPISFDVWLLLSRWTDGGFEFVLVFPWLFISTGVEFPCVPGVVVWFIKNCCYFEPDRAVYRLEFVFILGFLRLDCKDWDVVASIDDLCIRGYLLIS
jgi:hypothetical protein